MAVPQITIVRFKRGTQLYVLPVATKELKLLASVTKVLLDAIESRGDTVGDIRLAVPKDKLDISANQWQEIDTCVDLVDFDVLAFAFDDEQFEVVAIDEGGDPGE